MPESLDLKVLDLTEQDLAAAADVDEQKRRDRDFRRRSVEVAGVRYGVAASDIAALAQALSETAGASVLTTGRDYLPFPKPTLPRPGAARKRKRLPPRSPVDGVTDERRALIGFVGEYVALLWLQHTYQA